MASNDVPVSTSTTLSTDSGEPRSDQGLESTRSRAESFRLLLTMKPKARSSTHRRSFCNSRMWAQLLKKQRTTLISYKSNYDVGAGSNLLRIAKAALRIGMNLRKRLDGRRLGSTPAEHLRVRTNTVSHYIILILPSKKS